MTTMKKKESKSWQFATKAEALKKLAFLKGQETYEVVQNRLADGRITKGWVLRKRK